MSTSAATFRCSVAAAAREDPLPGTALVVSRFLLVEQPGPWGPDALVDSGLDPDVGRALAQSAREAGVRVLLIRRPGRHEERAGRRYWFLIDARNGHEQTLRGSFVRDDELLDLPLASGWESASGAEPEREPLYLVCTNGRHDVCCAIQGRPVAAALEAHAPGQVWEASHVGGDRFAATVVVLPWGLYYGRLDPASALEVLDATRIGRLLPQHLRGRSALPSAAQAAHVYAANELGQDAVSALALLSCRRIEPRRWVVRLAAAEGNLDYVVDVEAAGPSARLTCGAQQLAAPPRYSVTPLDTAF